MVLISKYDKKVWENYVSNFEKFVINPKNSLKKSKNEAKTITTYKNGNLLGRSKRFKKKYLKPEMILDLHGYNLYSAKLTLQKHIIDCYEKNIRNILVITGKGQNNKGVLRQEVPKWLNDKNLDKFLINLNIAPKHFGGDGALLVRIKNKFKKFN